MRRSGRGLALLGLARPVLTSRQPGKSPANQAREVARDVALVDDGRAMIRSPGGCIALAADPGSPAFVPGIRVHQVGKAQALVFDREPGNGAHPGENAQRWPIRVGVHDAPGPAVGDLTCRP